MAQVSRVVCRLLTLVGVVLVLAATSSSAVEPAPQTWNAWGRTKGQEVNLIAEHATRSGGSYEAGAAGGPATEKYYRATPEQCALFHGLDADTDLSRGCGENMRRTDRIECAPDAYYLGALYRQTRTIGPDGVPGAWSAAGAPVADQSCITPADLTAEAERALATLLITPSAVTVQPPDGWTLVNIPTITYTTADPQELATTLLGIPVTIRVTPDTFTWDYGDTTDPLITTDPGAPYPHHTVHHTYTQPADHTTITLTTTWTAQFRITGAPTWTPITGTPTTTSTAPPLRVHEARSRLVTDPLTP